MTFNNVVLLAGCLLISSVLVNAQPSILAGADDVLVAGSIVDDQSIAVADGRQPLQAVLNSGAALVLISGEHRLHRSVMLTKPGQRVLGGRRIERDAEGRQRIVDAAPARLVGNLPGRPVVEVQADRVVLEGLTLVNHSDALASTGLLVADAEHVQLRGLKIETLSNTGFGVVQYGGTAMLADTTVTTVGCSAHGVFPMAHGHVTVSGFYHFLARHEQAEEAMLGMASSITANFSDVSGEYVSEQWAWEGENFTPTHVRRIPAGSVIDGISLVQDGLLMEGGAITGETLLSFAQAYHRGNNASVLLMKTIEGSADDSLNVELGREVHRLGLATHLHSGSDIASGAVDLFLAGVTRSAGEDVRFGVHSWGSFGEGPTGAELPRDDVAHQMILNYFAEVGVMPDFYWFTLKAASFDAIHWMTPPEVKRWKVLTD